MGASIHGSRLFLIGLLWAANISAQDFTISTVAGGAPPFTPAWAGQTSIAVPYGFVLALGLPRVIRQDRHTA